MTTLVRCYIGVFLCAVFSLSAHAGDVLFLGDARVVSPGGAIVGDTVEIEISPRIGLWNETHGPFYGYEPSPLDYEGTQRWIADYGYHFETIERIEYMASFAGGMVSALDFGAGGFGYSEADAIPPARLTLVATTAGSLEIVPSIRYVVAATDGGNGVFRERYCYGDYSCGEWSAERSGDIWSSTSRYEYSAVAPSLMVEIQAVPEPAAAMLLLVGIAISPWVLRRHHRP